MDASNCEFPSLTNLQTLVMLQVAKCSTLADVVRAVGLSPYGDSISSQTVYQTANRLADKGMIEKTRTTERESTVSITAEGRRALDTALAFCSYVQSAA